MRCMGTKKGIGREVSIAISLQNLVKTSFCKDLAASIVWFFIFSFFSLFFSIFAFRLCTSLGISLPISDFDRQLFHWANFFPHAQKHNFFHFPPTRLVLLLFPTLSASSLLCTYPYLPLYIIFTAHYVISENRTTSNDGCLKMHALMVV